MNFEALRAPFPPEKVSWRCGSTTADKTRGLALAYIDARDVMDRLDEVCGPENWQTSYQEMGEGRLACNLAIQIGNEWITKTDGAGEREAGGKGLSENDASKASFSDALKRAAVNWGIGRYLYDLPSPWVGIDKYRQILPDELAKLRRILDGDKVQNTKPKAQSRDRFDELVRCIRAQGTLDTLDEAWTGNRDLIDALPADWKSRAFVEFVKHGIGIASSIDDLAGFWKAYWGTIKGLSDDEQISVLTALKDERKAALSGGELTPLDAG